MTRQPAWGAVVLLAVLVGGCSHREATREPLTPVSYSAPSLRAANSVGRLARLAVVPVALDWEADRRQRSEPAFVERFGRVQRETRETLAAYLRQQKGYEVVVAEDAGARDLRGTGRRLGVDGVVVVERWVTEPWSAVDGVVNIMLMNIPLFRALSATNLRLSVYETASGRLAYRAEAAGEESEGAPVDWESLLGDLDNAVPPQLRR